MIRVHYSYIQDGSVHQQILDMHHVENAMNMLLAEQQLHLHLNRVYLVQRVEELPTVEERFYAFDGATGKYWDGMGFKLPSSKNAGTMPVHQVDFLRENGYPSCIPVPVTS